GRRRGRLGRWAWGGQRDRRARRGLGRLVRLGRDLIQKTEGLALRVARPRRGEGISARLESRGFLDTFVVQLAEVADRIGLEGDERILDRDPCGVQRAVSGRAHRAERDEDDERGERERASEA